MAQFLGTRIYAPAFRAQVIRTRQSGLEGNMPRGCFDSWRLHYKPTYDCGTRNAITGLYLSPAGSIRQLRGFDLKPQEMPDFETCSLTDAQGKIPVDADAQREPFGIRFREFGSEPCSTHPPDLQGPKGEKGEAGTAAPVGGILPSGKTVSGAYGFGTSGSGPRATESLSVATD